MNTDFTKEKLEHVLTVDYDNKTKRKLPLGIVLDILKWDKYDRFVVRVNTPLHIEKVSYLSTTYQFDYPLSRIITDSLNKVIELYGLEQLMDQIRT